MKQIIRTPDAPSSPLFSQAIKMGSTVYVSGIAGIDPKTNQVAGSTIQEQTRPALVNCETAPERLHHISLSRFGSSPALKQIKSTARVARCVFSCRRCTTRPSPDFHCERRPEVVRCKSTRL